MNRLDINVVPGMPLHPFAVACMNVGIAVPVSSTYHRAANIVTVSRSIACT